MSSNWSDAPAGMDRLLIPGLAIAVMQNGEMVFAEGLGVCKIGAPERVTPATRFMIGSSTEPLTALMMASDRSGRVDLGNTCYR